VAKTLARHHDKVEVLERLKSVRPESRGRWGRMSAHQMVCHLSDSFRILSGEKTASDAPGALNRTVVKWIALYLPCRWPAGILTTPELDQESGGTRPIDFAADVAELEGLVELVTSRKGVCVGRTHPIFGRLSEASWLRWGYLHMDHHLRQFGA
jgi:hypothetical protein